MKLIVTDQAVEIDLDDIRYFIQGLSVCTQPNGTKFVVFTAGPHKTKRLSRVIKDCPSYLEVDHKDGNPLNNTRDNLRVVTSQQNKFNTSPRDLTGLSKGVIKHGRGFKATITVNYKQIYLGIFNTAEEAGQAYRNAADKYFGEFALHNSRN